MKEFHVKHPFITRMIIRFIKFLNIVAMGAVFSYIWYKYFSWRVLVPFFHRGNWYVILLFMFLYTVFGRVYDAFSVSYLKQSETIYSQALSVFISDFFMYIVIMLLIRSYTVNPVPMLICFLIQLCISVLWTLVSHSWYFSTFYRTKSIIIWDEREGLESVIEQHDLNKKFDIIKVMNVTDVINNGLKDLDGMEIVFFAGVHSKQRNIIIKYCVQNNLVSFIIPRVGDVLMASAHKMHMLHLPVLRLTRYNPAPEYLFIKRLFDIVISLIGIIILSPFMIVTAIAIKTDGGPALYKQTRLTKDGREFKVLKFRSMKVDAEKDGVARLSTGEKDDRITKVGHIIRAIRFDELPQLFNILKGDMTIVGPRPERPEIAKQYYEELPEFELRLQCKAGLTGYAQVYGKYNTTPYDKLLMDLMYISNPSILQDLAIMFATVKILFMKDSTEGVDENQVTASINQK